MGGNSSKIRLLDPATITSWNANTKTRWWVRGRTGTSPLLKASPSISTMKITCRVKKKQPEEVRVPAQFNQQEKSICARHLLEECTDLVSFYYCCYCVSSTARHFLTDGETTKKEERGWQGAKSQDLYWNQKQPLWSQDQQEEIWCSGAESQAWRWPAWCVPIQSHYKSERSSSLVDSYFSS